MGGRRVRRSPVVTAEGTPGVRAGPRRPAGPGNRTGTVLSLQSAAGNAAVTGLVSRQVVPAAPKTAPKTRPQLWDDWEHQQIVPAKRLDLAAVLAQDLTFDEAIEHGARFAVWLENHAMADAAASTLRTLDMALHVRYSTDPALGGQTDIPDESQSITLIESGRSLAAAGRFDDASEMLTRAFLLVQMQAEAATRRADIKGKAAANDQIAAAGRPFTYMGMKGHYERMRQIFAIHPTLAAELRTAGRTAEATAVAQRGQQLRATLKDQFTLRDPENSDDLTGRAMISEISHVTTKAGPALRIHGDNFTDEDVTQLPGLPNPAEVEGRIQHSGLAELGTALAGQVDLVRDLLDRPEVARLFPDGTIDMGDRGQRLKVWGALWPVLQREKGAGALGALLDLMERYLKAFTVHTDYNIRDFGVSYLDSAMPKDLAGRAEQDCGVYALTVAYELFLTMRAGGPVLDFTLVSVPGHVMLAISVRGKGELFVVNNAEIDGPHSGSIEEIAARFVAPVFGNRYLVTPAMSKPIGSTGMKDGDFKKSAWEGFRDTSSWGLEVPPGPAGETPDQLRERTSAVHQNFYDGINAFDKLCAALQAGLDAASKTDRATVLGRQLAELEATFVRAQTLFDLLVGTGWAGNEKDRPGVGQRLTPYSRILFAMPAAVPPHPLARTAMALLRLTSLGGTLSATQQAMVTFWLGFQPFDKQVAAYQAAGAPAGF